MARWIKVANELGRVNLSLVSALHIDGVGPFHVDAMLVEGPDFVLADGFATKADAMTYIDALLLDGN